MCICIYCLSIFQSRDRDRIILGVLASGLGGGSERGVVLLDLSSSLKESNGQETLLCTVSGYRFGKFVLTVAPHFLTHYFNHERLSLHSEASVKISCYWLDNVSLKAEHVVHVCYVWRVELVERAINNIKKLNLKPFMIEGDRRNCWAFDGSFMLIKLGDKYFDGHTLTEALTQLSLCSKSQELTHGQDMFTRYAPFGVSEFMNSCSRGCLSNKFDEGILLIDGRLAPCCEGAPVYTKSDASNFPVGVVLFPIEAGKDHSSYSLVVPMHYVIDAFLNAQKLYNSQIERTHQVLSWNRTVRDALNNVIIVQTPDSWGSGIVVSRGLIVTSAHVIEFNHESAVTIVWGKRTISAEVLFHSKTSSLLDLAVLKYNKAFGPPGIKFSKEDPEVGETVFAVGNPLQIRSDVPSLSKGVVLSYWKNSAGFSTSCIINAGSSGGAIVREDGTLLGMMVGIFKSDKRAYPEMNICICASLLQFPLLSYLETGDVSRLHSLLNYDDTWLRAMMNLPKSKY